MTSRERVLTLSQAFYAETLDRSPEGLDYLAARGVPVELARRLGLGYAPDRWTALVDHLRTRGVTAEEAHDAGVGMPTRRGTIVDALRCRLIFPGRDERGTVVGLTGRAAPGSPDHAPRYLDTYRRGVKGQVLHGLADGRALLARGATPVLVEGPLDAVNVTRVTGGRCVGLAPGGVALSADHVAALDRVSGLQGRRVVVAFDGDDAGRRAAVAAFPLLRAVGARPDVATLPPGTDPGQLAVEDPARLRDALRTARPLADLVVDERVASWADHLQWTTGRVAALHDAVRVVPGLPADQVARQVARLAERLDLEPSTVTGALLDAVEGGQARGWASPPAVRAGPVLRRAG